MKKTFDDKSWSFLIASPTYNEPIFDKGVILLLEDNEEGALGIIINRPTGRKLGEAAERFASGSLAEIEIFDGGPLSKDSLSLAVYTDDELEEGALAFGVTPQHAEDALKKNPSAHIYAFTGYAGWGAGQLQREIDEGTWILSNVDVNMMFEVDPEELWEELLVRENPIYENFPVPEGDIEKN